MEAVLYFKRLNLLLFLAIHYTQTVAQNLKLYFKEAYTFFFHNLYIVSLLIQYALAGF
jgi:hypothetical protein